MTAISHEHQASSTFAEGFGTAGLSGVVRGLTRSLLDAWKHLPIGRRQPKDAKLASLRADVMIGHVKPMEHLVRLSFGAIDAGVPVAAVTAWVKEYLTACEQYAGRITRRRASGILSFPERWRRVWTRETREQGEADAVCIAIQAGADLNTLRACRVELQDHREAIDAQIDLVTEQIMAMEAQG